MPVVTVRPSRRQHAVHRTATSVARPAGRPRPLQRWSKPVFAPPPLPGYGGPDCYLDYGRALTPEGGVLIIYKDLDLRWRHTLWRLSAWSVATGSAGWYLWHRSPVHAVWINLLCFVAIALLNWLIVAKPVEVYRRIEIRPDCLILKGTEVFWRDRMEGGLPTLQPDDDGNQILCGVYGTRFVEYGTLRRFDEFDRMPETFAAHLAEAIGQLWQM